MLLDIVLGIALLLSIASGVAVLLILRDIEVKKKMFRRYVAQIDKEGSIHTKVSWHQMKNAMFIWPAWFYRLPNQTSRPDLTHWPELVEIRGDLRGNWKILRWSVLTLLVSILLVYVIADVLR